MILKNLPQKLKITKKNNIIFDVTGILNRKIVSERLKILWM